MKRSAGLLVFRERNATLEVLLVHPGGPFFHNRDDGAWSIPKGETTEGEDVLGRARIEFEEELGIPAPTGRTIELGSVKQKGGKVVYAWAIKGDLEKDFQPASNAFIIEWPPHSGQMSEFPEVDRAQFFDLAMARQKINPAQITFIDRLRTHLSASL